MRTRKDKIERACVGREDMDERIMQKDRDEACAPEYVRARTYLFYWALLQKRPVILRSLLIVCSHTCSGTHTHTHTLMCTYV